MDLNTVEGFQSTVIIIMITEAQIVFFDNLWEFLQVGYWVFLTWLN